MFARICQIASLLSLLLSVSMAAFGYVAIRYMGSLEDKLPDVMGNKIPDLTGPSIQLPDTPKVNKLGNSKN